MDTISGDIATGDTPMDGVLLGNCSVPIWGVGAAEWLGRALRRAGVSRVGLWNGSAPPRPFVMLRVDWIVDEALVRALVRAPVGTVLIDPATGAWVGAHVRPQDAPALADALRASGPVDRHCLTGLTRVEPAQLAAAYSQSLRKREPPFLLPLCAQTRNEVEARMFAASYKGVTDFVTKYVWPWPARYLTKLSAAAGLTPNQVTSASLALVIAAFWLFLEGHFLLGLASAWAMTLLDTVDGKLARVTLTSTRWGNVFDHGIDLVHPPFWWWAWIAGLKETGLGLGQEAVVVAIVLGGYVLLRVQEGLFLGLFGIEIHVWRRFDSSFRLVVARRNSILLLLTAGALMEAPAAGMLVVAGWTAISVAVHALQIASALIAARRRSIVSWLAA